MARRAFRRAEVLSRKPDGSEHSGKVRLDVLSSSDDAIHSTTRTDRPRVGPYDLELEASSIASEPANVALPLDLSRPAQSATAAQTALFKLSNISGGSPLTPSVREPLEARLSASLGLVRVHTDPRAAAIARSLGARAWTFGSDIGFAQGAWAPETAQGRRLLTHEAVHASSSGVAHPLYSSIGPLPESLFIFPSASIER